MTATHVDSAIIDRIRKILAKTTEANCTAAEAEAAFAFASRLMADHNIHMEEVGTASADPDTWVKEEIGSVAKWTMEQNLAQAICRDFFFIQPIFLHARPDPQTGKQVKPVVFFGKKENVEVARFTFSSLMAAFWTLFEDYQLSHGAKTSERRTFVAGVAKGFRDKLLDERKAQEAERDIMEGHSGGTSIVLASIAKKTMEKFQEAFPSQRKTWNKFSSPKGSRSSFDAGYQSGRSLNLNRGIGGSGRKKIGG